MMINQAEQGKQGPQFVEGYLSQKIHHFYGVCGERVNGKYQLRVRVAKNGLHMHFLCMPEDDLAEVCN